MLYIPAIFDKGKIFPCKSNTQFSQTDLTIEEKQALPIMMANL